MLINDSKSFLIVSKYSNDIHSSNNINEFVLPMISIHGCSSDADIEQLSTNVK